MSRLANILRAAPVRERVRSARPSNRRFASGLTGRSSAARRCRWAGAILLAVTIGSSPAAKAGPVADTDFKTLVTACIQETSLKHLEERPLHKALEDLGFKPLQQEEATVFARLTVPVSWGHAIKFSQKYPEHSPDPVAAIAEGFSEILAQHEDQVRETAVSESTSSGFYSIFTPESEIVGGAALSMRRSPWDPIPTYVWQKRERGLALKARNTRILYGSEVNPDCEVTGISEEAALALLQDTRFQFDEQKLGKVRQFTADFSTLPAFAVTLFFLVSGKETQNNWVHARIQLTQYPQYLADRAGTSPWHLSVYGIPET